MTDTPAAPAETDRPRRKAPERGKAGGRTKTPGLRVSEAELAACKERAAEAGLSFSAFAVASMLGDAGPRRRRRPTVDRAALDAARAELRRVGNNVNQIARSLNRGREAEAVAEAMAELVAVLALFRKVPGG